MTRPRTAAVALVLLGSALGGCSRFDSFGSEPSMTPPGQPRAAVVPPHPGSLPVAAVGLRAAPSAGSVWQPVSLFSDRRARSVGDILTVLISISDKARINSSTERERSASEQVGVGGLFGLEKEVDDLLPGQVGLQAGADLSSDSRADGSGTIRRDETIELKVAAVVTDTMPNGNLVILGSQEVRVNYELRDLQIAGVIRPEDISRDNTISYDKIAEARIAYGGRGQIYSAQQPRYGQQLFDIVSPF